MTSHPAGERARQLFETQVAALPLADASRLRAARRMALTNPHPLARRWTWPAAGGLVTAALALLLVAPRLDAPPASTPSGPALPQAPSVEALQSAALAADKDELDEDAAFYLWLGEAPLDTRAPPSPLDEGALL